MRNLVIVFALIALYFGIKKIGGPAIEELQRKAMDKEIAASVDDTNARLPITTPDGSLRIERMEYSGHVLRLVAQQLVKEDLTPQLKATIENGVKSMYCTGGMKTFRTAGIPVETQIRSAPRSLEDLGVDTWFAGHAERLRLGAPQP